MSMVEAVKICLRKYVSFSGRASRAEFWKFVLGIFLASILAAIANVMIFGPVTEAQFVLRTTSEGTTQHLQQKIQYGPGPFSTLLGFAVLLPFLAAASRRLHDIGRPVWHLALPWVVSILLIAITLVAFTAHVPVSEAIRAAHPSIGETMAVPQPPLPLFVAAWLLGFTTFVLSIIWFTRRGQPEANRYGPSPMASNP